MEADGSRAARPEALEVEAPEAAPTPVQAATWSAWQRQLLYMGLAACACGALLALACHALAGRGSGDAAGCGSVEGTKALFAGAIFFGHMNPDLDSIGSAYGSAEIYGGTAACPAPRDKCPTDEARFVMKRFGVTDAEVPMLTDVMAEDSRYVLVDFNGMAKGPRNSFPEDELLPPKGPLIGDDGMWLTPPVMGSIDHHALQLTGVKVTDMPVDFCGQVGPGGFQVETHPWGSACSILATKFQESGRTPSKKAAGMLLGGILSDTLGLTGPTTTEHDRQAVEFLKPFANIVDHSTFYGEMAEAKSEKFLSMPLVDVFGSDLKVFEPLPEARLVIGVVEVANRKIYEGLLGKPASEQAAGIDGVSKQYCSGAGPGKACLVFVVLVDTKDRVSSTLMLKAPSAAEPSERCMAVRAFSLDQATNKLPEDKECRPNHADEKKLPSGDPVGSGLLHVISTGDCISRKSQLQPSLEAAIKDFYGPDWGKKPGYTCEEPAARLDRGSQTLLARFLRDASNGD